ncbi:MAG TPA: hypothetical protein VKT71_02535 [Candidatus Acidoferrales bacterium]|nr:hypothetical protein [Candidatus Acidoferrales bacterium]
MKNQISKHAATAVKLLLGLLFATCVFAATASAQPSFEGKFTLPYAVRWNHVTLPAGEYFIELDAKGLPAVLRSKATGKSVNTIVPIVDDSEEGAARLMVTIRGDERVVRSVNLPQIGKSLVFEPLTKSERETFAKEGTMNAVPVITASK